MTFADLVGRDVDRLQPFGDRLEQRAVALLRHRGVEAGVDHDGAARADDRPDEEVERLGHVVRIAADVVLGRLALVVAVFDGVDFVDVVGHGYCSPSHSSWPGLSRPSTSCCYARKSWMPGTRPGMTAPILLLREHFARLAERIDAGRHAGIDRRCA